MVRPEQKNVRVRKVMAEYGIDQRKLSSILGWTESKASLVLGVCELAKSEQDIIIKAIREWAAS